MKTCVLVSAIFLMAMISFAAPGQLDLTFSGDGKLIDGNGTAYDVAVQGDGKIVVVGGSLGDIAIARYNPDGSPDTTFGSGTGRVRIDLGREDNLWSIVFQPDGKIVAGGVSATNGAASFFIVRLNSDGSLDTAFGGGTGRVLTALPCGDSNDNYGVDLAIQPDGKLVGAVRFEWCAGKLIRYGLDGSVDVSFGSQGFVTQGGVSNPILSDTTAVFMQPDGKVIWGIGSGIYRYEPNGLPDLSFDSGSGVSPPISRISNIILQPDGKIIANGGSALARYNINGSLDTSFGSNGSVRMPMGGYLMSAAVQPDGKIVAAGSSSGNNQTLDFTLLRYNRDGSPDVAFGGGDGFTTIDFNNSSDYAVGLALDNRGRAVVVGSSGAMFAIARFLLAPPSTAFDFDGDGRSDVSVFRPSDSVWYLDRSTNGFAATQFGFPTDKIAPADFDGDGKTDIAVFRDGMFFWLNSSNGVITQSSWGAAGDTPLPGDYTGDGRAELAVFRAINRTWFIYDLVTGTSTTTYFGVPTDTPVPADYDGDGRTEIAVYRNGIWFRRLPGGSFLGTPFGISTDRPVVGDYDGDGKADQAVYRNGTWYLLQSRDGIAAFQFGTATDVPVPADYDGDGRTDLAVYRDGIWYISQRSGGFSAVPFGLLTDKPVPAAYLP